MENPQNELKLLREELLRMNREFHEKYDAMREERRLGWRFGWGPLRFNAGIRSGYIGIMYAVVVGSLFAAGITLTLAGGTSGDLGPALIVGSLFALGSFLTEAWSLQIQREREIQAEIFKQDHASALESLRTLCSKAESITQSIHEAERLS